MVTNKIFINSTFFTLIILMICHINSEPIKTWASTSFYKDINETCSINLHCQTGCCSKELCAEAKKCKDIANEVYKYQVIACIALVFIFSNYLLLYLRKIKQKFEAKIRNNNAQNPPQNQNNIYQK